MKDKRIRSVEEEDETEVTQRSNQKERERKNRTQRDECVRTDKMMKLIEWKERKKKEK